MMNFIMITCGVFVGTLLSMVTVTVLTYTLLMNQKVMNYLMKRYMKVVEKTMFTLEDDQKWGA